MRKTILSMALVALIGGPERSRRDRRPFEEFGRGWKRGGGGVIQAPVGHRQPRASDVPNEKNLSDPNDPLEQGKRSPRPQDQEHLPRLLG